MWGIHYPGVFTPDVKSALLYTDIYRGNMEWEPLLSPKDIAMLNKSGVFYFDFRKSFRFIYKAKI